MRYFVKIAAYIAVDAEDMAEASEVANAALANVQAIREVPGVSSCSIWSDGIKEQATALEKAKP
jgi:hypothetical protein